MTCSLDTPRIGFLVGILGVAFLASSCGVTPDPGPVEPRLIVVRHPVTPGHVQRLLDAPPVRWTLVGPEGISFDFEGRAVGRSSYSIDDLPEGCPYTDLGVVRFEDGGPARTLSFVFHGPDEDHGVVVYEQSADGDFHLLARTRPGVQAYDWPVFAHDRTTLAVWGDGLDQYERNGAWFEPTASVRGGWFKAFPVVSDQGRVAARLIRPNPYAEAVVVDGVVGEEWERVRDPVFSIDGAHVAYMARRDGEWHLVVDGLPHGPTQDLRIAAWSHDPSLPILFVLRGEGPGATDVLGVMDANLVDVSAFDALDPRRDLPQGPFAPRR